MSKTLTIDPVTRIEGHLAIHVEIDSGRIVTARAAGEMFRGFETILKGRSPFDAQQITQRICGVCPVSHGIASTLAQEAAGGVEVPVNGRLARNLMQAMDFIHSHLFHFYQMSLPDYLDVTVVRDYEGNDPVLNGFKAWMGSTGEEVSALHPSALWVSDWREDFRREPDFVLPVLKHALDALGVRSLAQQAGALFAGKLPHAASIMPGGITETVTVEKIAAFRSLLRRLRDFVETAYFRDALALAEAYPAAFGEGAGCVDYLSSGAFAGPEDGAAPLFPGGVLVSGDLREFDPSKITEEVRFARYDSPSGLHPSRGETAPAPKKEEAYTWIKAPRYDGTAVEVGALARLVVAFRKEPEGRAASLMRSVCDTLDRLPETLVSTMGRHLARAMECRILAERCVEWVDALRPDAPSCVEVRLPDACEGAGFTEAPRGALSHWITIRGGRIDGYQCVVPTTWNASPRDDRAVPGPMEQALEGLPVADPERPVEAVRVVRSFDPCIACAVH